jgi:hypothetical protein
MIFNTDKRIKNNIELISLHIPKTAGTSFRQSLKEIYGDESAVRLDINNRLRTVKINEKLFEGKALPKEIRVIHGHFHIDHLFEDLRLPNDLPMITWMRDPVKRVISNYYYLEQRLKEELDEESKGLNILEKMQRNLIEYARADVNRNVQARYIANTPLKRFKFIGIADEYSEEIKRLQSVMNWPQLTIHKVNVTKKKRPDLAQDWIEEIKELNSVDMELFREALAIRQQDL